MFVISFSVNLREQRGGAFRKVNLLFRKGPFHQILEY